MSSSFISVDFIPSLKPNHEHRFFKPVPGTPFLKNKEYAWNLVGKSCKNMNKWKNEQTSRFVRYSNVNPPPEAAPLPSGSPSGSLRNWIVGIVLTFVLPFITHKWGPLLLLKGKPTKPQNFYFTYMCLHSVHITYADKVDKKIQTTEHVVKAIENIAEKADKVIDGITDNLPKGSRLKEKLEFFDEIVEGVAKGAHVADELINKVEEAEDKLESLITHENSKGDEIPQEDEDKEDQEITRKSENNKNTKQI